MASTAFLDHTNRLLRRLNEVEIAGINFPATIGIQSMAKDAVNAAIEYINSKQFKWPFNATTGTQLLIVGQTEYTFPANFKVSDSDSFYIQKDDTLGTNTVKLDPINRETYLTYFKQIDLDAGSSGRGVPISVFKGHANKSFGLTPSPNKAYTTQFDYWQQPVNLVDATDAPTIPSEYDEVITQSALYHFYMFRDNLGEAQEAEAMMNSMIDQMAIILIGSDNTMQSTMMSRPALVGRIATDYFVI